MFVDKLFCLRVFISVLSLIIFCLLYLFDIYLFPYFVIFCFIIFMCNMPRHIVSPLSFFYLYYGAFYIAAPLFAERYAQSLQLKEYSISFLMLYTTLSLGVCAINFGEVYASKKRYVVKHFVKGDFTWYIIFLLMVSSLMCYLIVYYSGGLQYWMESPGDAFLNRAGTGPLVILSHFSSIFLAVLVGYHTYEKKSFLLYFIFIIWLAITSPVHGSKMQISLLFLLSIMPWIRYQRFLTIKSLLLFSFLVGIFFLGLYFRNASWVTLETILPYAFNYFTALENLAVSVRDFDANLLTTFWLPFNKFLTPFGLSDSSLFYDMNHYLTAIYFPEAWKIRATEQWPVETDMYLNFYFVFGIPLVLFYLSVVGYLYGLALKFDRLGYWASSFLMIIFMMSHLRGSLYNHVDFYMYPYILFIWFSLYKFRFSIRG
ncbi:O-antigen polymerase [Aeromonas veronii]|uniref:O-antigen polymerase n=1 Tax=Aeromonas veronii TaxID=654 RepID=UPI003F78AFC1